VLSLDGCAPYHTRSYGIGNSPQIGHPEIGLVLKVTGFCGDGRAAGSLLASMSSKTPQKRIVALSPRPIEAFSSPLKLNSSKFSSFLFEVLFEKEKKST
jgi:hypothetical protein